MDTAKNRYRDVIQIGSTYRYRELCDIFQENTKTGEAKICQLRRWKGYIDWVNPTKQTYTITKIYDYPEIVMDGRIHNGGRRDGAGAKRKLQDEFDFLFNMFLHREFNRNIYDCIPDICSSHFTNSEIGRLFGLYGDGFYSAKADFSDIVRGNDDKIDRFCSAWDDIAKKIMEKRNSWIYRKIEDIDGISFGYGIVAYKGRDRKSFDCKDEWLDIWNDCMKVYMRMNRLRSISDIIDSGSWDDMVSYVSGFFDGYERVERTRLIRFDTGMLKEYDIDMYGQYRKRFNDKVCDEIGRYFSKRVDDGSFGMYRYIIEKYVRI